MAVLFSCVITHKNFVKREYGIRSVKFEKVLRNQAKIIQKHKFKKDEVKKHEKFRIGNNGKLWISDL